ncbi:MAG: ROK family transcriptional regulator [Candidatus Glassbacteria bacterium]|nr:ROK family transcriptional regulator [Candidatus Glassbacteria bacterium]
MSFPPYRISGTIRVKKLMPHAHKKIRALNRSAVLNTIITHGPISRVRLSRSTGLNQSTVSKITSELIGEGAIYEASQDDANALGRKPVNLRVSPSYRIYGSIDTTIRHATLSVCDLSGEVLSQQQIETFPNDADKFFDLCAARLAEMVDEFTQPLAGVSVIVAAVLNSETGMIFWNNRLGWKNVSCRKPVERHFECPVFVENNAKAGAVAEFWFADEARGLSNFVYVLVCEGVGIGTVIHGKLYNGARFMDGRFYSGIVEIDGDYETPSKGTTWEDKASFEGIVDRYCELSGQPREDDFGSQAIRLIDMAVEGDSDARKALRETAKWLGAGLANINNGLDPERIILCGHLVKAWKLIYPELLDQLRSRAPYPMEHLPDLIVPCSLQNPTFSGARALVLQHMLGDHDDGSQPVARTRKSTSKTSRLEGVPA